MSAEQSAYATLGLRPGARRVEVDEAYRRLIKLHHPDRTGGDGNRAAEINRAYTFLRSEGLATSARVHRRMPVPVHRPRSVPSHRAGWFLVLVLATAAAAGFGAIDNQGGLHRVPHRIALTLPTAEPMGLPTLAPPLTSFDEPLNAALVDDAVASALQFHSTGDIAGAGEYSRQCHARLRKQPNLAWFDTCSAFDEATVTLRGDELAADSSAFGASAVVVREVAAARAVSGDVIGAEFRLHQIRSRVELKLLPVLDPAAGRTL